MKIQAFKGLIITAIIAFIAVPTLTRADEVSVGGADVNGATAETVLNVGGTDTNGAETNISSNPTEEISVGGTDTNGAEAGLNVGGTNTNGAETNISSNPTEEISVGGQNVNGAVSEPTPPSNTGNGSGPVGSTGGSSSSSSSSSSGSVMLPQYRPALSNIGQCSYLTSYLKLGGNNAVTEVSKLQLFLRDSEKMNVDITGIFDQKTHDAVVAFQAKYVNDVMIPWGATTPTGHVYFTTQKKINEIYCKTNFTLTDKQLAEITAYKNAVARGENPLVESTTEEIGSNSTKTDNTSVAEEKLESTDQTAAVAGTSFFSRVWRFVKGIFGN